MSCFSFVLKRIDLDVHQQGTVPKWEKLRRHDTDATEKAALISSVLQEVLPLLHWLSSCCRAAA